jgi:quinol monooxygenase YgiN
LELQPYDPRTTKLGEDLMTVIMQQTMPEGTTLEMLDEVTREMHADTDPPTGLVVHTHFDEGGRTRVVDVWDSQEAYESFLESRLMPAMQKVAAGQGMDMSQAPQPETSFLSVHVVKGR